MLDAIRAQPKWAPKKFQIAAFDQMIGRVGNTPYLSSPTEGQLVFTDINYDRIYKNQTMIETIDYGTNIKTTYIQETKITKFGNGSVIEYSPSLVT